MQTAHGVLTEVEGQRCMTGIRPKYEDMCLQHDSFDLI